MWDRRELKSRAKEALKMNYWKAVLVSLILAVLTGSTIWSSGGSAASGQSASAYQEEVGTIVDSMDVNILLIFLAVLAGVILTALIIDMVLKIFLWNILEVGCQKFFVDCKNHKAGLKEIVFGFSNGYGNIVKVMFLKNLFLVLWTLLLVVPGIIKAYEYRMIPYLLADQPDLSGKEVFARSKEMMRGNKWRAFVLDLSFIGWYFLSAFTFGLLAVFYVAPYVNLTDAELYHALKGVEVVDW